ncbi:MAG TPA: imidazolonepropionase [Thermoanaerobaculia bacterium]|nr:imidazolonepropionase [Thermoanaerobaculia bacterium]
MSSILIRNLAEVATPCGITAQRGRKMRELRVVRSAAITIRDGLFDYVGPEKDLPREDGSFDEEIDARGATAIPGFVDSHTHLPFAGYRESELNRRLQGESYEDIAASGGGIAATVHATRAASKGDLVANILRRTEIMALHGTTTAEAKSGYGLNYGDEMKQLAAIDDANDASCVRLVPTCLAAHDFPPESKAREEGKSAYIDLILERILPEVSRRKLAKYCDVFVERGVYSIEQGRAILSAGRDVGLRPRIHADELSDSGGALLAVEIGAASADHLMYVSDGGIAALSASGTVANLLPATSFFLMSERYAPGRRLIDSGAIVSLSTDCNPGSSMTESMAIVIQLATLNMKLTIEEALTAATLNGAHSLGLAAELGSIEPGKVADLVLLDAPSHFHLVYHFGVNLVRDVFRNGKAVVHQGRVV